MSNTPTLHLIVGKWRTPNHSNNKSQDDTHVIKEEILKEVRKSANSKNEKSYEKQVGNNPDIDIDKNGIIILKGRDRFKNKPYYITDIPAKDYFVLRFKANSQESNIEIQLLHFYKEINREQEFGIMIVDDIYVLPAYEAIVSSFIDWALLNTEHDTDIVAFFINE